MNEFYKKFVIILRMLRKWAKVPLEIGRIILYNKVKYYAKGGILWK